MRSMLKSFSFYSSVLLLIFILPPPGDNRGELAGGRGISGGLLCASPGLRRAASHTILIVLPTLVGQS